MVHTLYIRACHKVIQDLLGVLPVTLQTKGQRLGSLQQKERIEGRDRSTFIAKDDGTDVGYECSLSGSLYEGYAVVGLVRLCELREELAGGPVKGSAVYDNAAEGRSMSADELGCGMYHDVCAIFNWTNQIRCSEGVINDKRQAVTVCNLCDGLDIRNVCIGVCQCLDIDGTCILVDRCLNLFQVSGVHEFSRYAVIRKGVPQQVVGAAIDGCLSDNVLPCMSQCGDCIGNSCCTGSNGQSTDAALKGIDSLLENALCGVRQSPVDVAGIAQCETICGMLCIVEHIRGCLINRNGSGIGSRICLLLSYVQLLGLKFEFMFAHGLISFLIEWLIV